jgi:flagellar hook-basal body complex protein FliE
MSGISYAPPSPPTPWPIFDGLQWILLNSNVTKNYVDSTFLMLSGGTMTGPINAININMTGTLTSSGNISMTSSGATLSIAGSLIIPNSSITIGSTLLTSTALELNYLHGSTPGTVTASNALVVDSGRNIVNINNIGVNTLSIGSLVLNSTDLAYINGITPGTISASCAVVVDSNKDISSFRNLTAINLTGTLSTAAQPNITSLGTLTSLSLSGVLSSSNTTDSTSTSTGSINTAGGIGIAKSAYIGSTLNVSGQSNLNVISNQGNMLTGDVSGSNGFFRIVNSASVLYIQTGVSSSAGSSADLFFGNISQAYNASSRRLMWKSSGKLGIQTYSPQTECSINGTLRICNSGDGTETDYSQFSQVSGGSLKLYMTGSLTSALLLQQNSATTNLGIASGLDMGTAYQTRALALTATTGGIAGSEYYGFGTTSAQNLENYSYGGFRWLTSSTTSALGNVKMTLSQAGALVITDKFTIGDGKYIGCSSSPNIMNMASAGVCLIGTSTVANSSNWLEVAAGGGGTYSAYFAGRVGIGQSSPSFPLDISISSTTSTSSSFGYLASSGAGTATSFTNRPFSIRCSSGVLLQSGEVDVISDQRLKRNISNISEELVSKVMSLNSIRFQYKSQDLEDSKYHLSFIAQDLVKKGLSDLVSFIECDEPIDDQDIECYDGSVVYLRNNQKLIINLQEFIPILHKAIQLQADRIQLQSDQIKNQADQIKILKDRNSALRDAMLAVEDSNSVLRTAIKVIIDLLPAKKKESILKLDIIKQI